MFIIPDWPDSSPQWSNDNLGLLTADADAQQPPSVDLNIILQNSEAFPIPFPIESVRSKVLKEQLSNDVLERNINSVYPVIHENVLYLYASFLLFKRKFGSNVERDLYKNLPLLGFIQRLLVKRAVMFVFTSNDSYLLLDGTTGFGNWEKIGTTSENEKLNLKKCLSYDEIKLSAFLSISSYTDFLNDGNRYNSGVRNRSNVEPEGIIIGLIGPRFEKKNVMEYEEVVVSEEQNQESNGYGTQFAPTIHSLLSGFYGEASLTFSQAIDIQKTELNRFNKLHDNSYFDNQVYSKRIALSIDTLLLEANDRALKKNTTAFVHVVGIGLGVWKISSHQNSLFLDVFAKRIQILGSKLQGISDIVFAYFNENASCGGHHNGDTIHIEGHPKNGIKIFIGKREPHTKLQGSDEGKLLVVSYAWDGNSLPGNEFWIGSLSGSGDPAAASSTQIAEIHNPHINPIVCAENLRIATPNGLIPYIQYCQDLKASQNK